MHLAIRRFAILMVLATCLAGTAAIGQESEGGGEKAFQTRGELMKLLRQYPPRLGEVLKLDPSLLANENYLVPYPEVRAFLQRHPEVVRDPSFFFGSISNELEDLKLRAREAEIDAQFRNRDRSAAEHMLNVLMPFAIFFGIVGVLMWLLRRFQEHRQFLRVWRTQSEAHSKLMDRLTSNEDTLAYLNTPAGKRFFESSWMPIEAPPARPNLPVGRIIWSVQAGLLLLFGGISLRLVSGLPQLTPDDIITFNIFSVMGIGLGISLIVGAAASFMISAKLGLIEQPAPVRRPPSVVEPPSST
jgi:hypothetical protein